MINKVFKAIKCDALSLLFAVVATRRKLNTKRLLLTLISISVFSFSASSVSEDINFNNAPTLLSEGLNGKVNDKSKAKIKLLKVVSKGYYKLSLNDPDIDIYKFNEAGDGYLYKKIPELPLTDSNGKNIYNYIYIPDESCKKAYTGIFVRRRNACFAVAWEFNQKQLSEVTDRRNEAEDNIKLTMEAASQEAPSPAESCGLGVFCSSINEDASTVDAWVYMEKNDSFDGSKHCYIRSPDMYYENFDSSKKKFHMRYVADYRLYLSSNAESFFDDAEMLIKLDDGEYLPLSVAITSDAMLDVLLTTLYEKQRLAVKYRKYRTVGEFVIPYTGFIEVRDKLISCVKSDSYKAPRSWGFSSLGDYQVK